MNARLVKDTNLIPYLASIIISPDVDETLLNDFKDPSKLDLNIYNMYGRTVWEKMQSQEPKKLSIATPAPTPAGGVQPRSLPVPIYAGGPTPVPAPTPTLSAYAQPPPNMVPPLMPLPTPNLPPILAPLTGLPPNIAPPAMFPSYAIPPVPAPALPSFS